MRARLAWLRTHAGVGPAGQAGQTGHWPVVKLQVLEWATPLKVPAKVTV